LSIASSCTATVNAVSSPISSADAGDDASAPGDDGPASDDGGPVLPVGPTVISTSSGSAVEAETSVAITSDGVVGVAYMADSSGVKMGSIGYRFSPDRGATWTDPATVVAPHEGWASDPVLVAAPDGTFYLVWDGANDANVFVSTAPKGTFKFGPPVAASGPSDGSHDKTWLSQTSSGALLASFTLYDATSDMVYVSRSADGKAWAAKSQLGQAPGVFGFSCPPAHGSHVYAVKLGDDGNIYLAHSDDDGATWPASAEIVVATQSDGVGLEPPSCTAEGDDVYVSYGQGSVNPPTGQATPLTGIRVAHSGDGGKSIEASYDVADKAAGKVFVHPFLVREDTGALDIAYYVASASGDAQGSFRRARSTDGGKSWSPSVVVGSPVGFDLKLLQPHWLGDYSSIAVRGGLLFATFADNSSGTSHVSFAVSAVP
jgi:hypothetical protein